jgi:putative ABC transport system ATP-binding protein
MLELEGVVKHYRGAGEEVHAVDGVSLTVRAGEMVALHGPSGSGKTTLLLLIAALLQPERGTIRYDGRDLSSLSEDEAVRLPAARRRLHLPAIPPDATRLGARERARKLLLGGVRMREAQEQREAVAGARRARRSPRRTPGELSGGELPAGGDRAGARGEPRLILADEPTGNLDSVRSADRRAAQLDRARARRRRAARHPRRRRGGDRRPQLALRDGKLSEASGNARTSIAR